MIEVSFSDSFNKVFKKRIKGNEKLESKFFQRLEWFIATPFDKRLRTHKLSGQLKDLWSFTVDYGCRVVFYFETSDKVVLVDIGTHDEVY